MVRASKLSIFGNVLAETGWPSVMGIVERSMYLVHEQNFVDSGSSKFDCCRLSDCSVPGTVLGQAVCISIFHLFITLMKSRVITNICEKKQVQGEDVNSVFSA